MFSKRAQWSAPVNQLTPERRKRGELLDLTATNPTRVSLPYPDDELAEAMARGARESYDPDPRGLRSAREALAAGLHCDADDLILTASTSEAYSFLFKLLTDPGDVVLTATPSYPLLEHLASLELVALRTFAMEFHRRWEIHDVPVDAKTRAILVVNPNNPTGSFVSRAEQDALAAHGIPIISDEVFLDYPVEGSGTSFVRDDVLTFTLGGLSKSAGLPHFKLAWIRVSGPAAQKRAALEGLELIADNFLSVATPVQAALPELLRLAPEIRDAISRRLRRNLATLRMHIKPSTQILPVEGGWSVVLRVPRVMSDDELALALLDRGVVVQPGYFYDFHADGYLVLSLLTREEVFAVGVMKLADIIPRVKQHWALDPTITFLNHGSFGATPRIVLEKQSELRAQMEREPVRFFVRELEPLLDDARQTLATFLNADPAGLAFVPNATAGVNAVLRSLDLDKFDELLVTTQEYNASRNVLDYVAGIAGAKVIVADVPFPIESPEVVIERVMEKVSDRTRLLLIDHVTSQTALILPIERLVKMLAARGIDTLVDGAHAPGSIPLDLTEIGAAYYTGNLHKWVCAPKGAAFLHVRENRRRGIRPISISHGANATRTDRSRFFLEFDWTGTFDPTAWLSVPAALAFMDSLGGWSEVMRRNQALALLARDRLCETLQIPSPAPDDMLAAMAAVPIEDGDQDELQNLLLFEHGIEVPIMPWPQPPKGLLRVSAQLYNEPQDYDALCAALLLHFR